MGEIVIKRDFAGDGIFFVVGDGRAFIDLSPARRSSGYVCERRGELGFTRVAVSNDSQIPELLSSESFHGRQDLLKTDGFQPASHFRSGTRRKCLFRRKAG